MNYKFIFIYDYLQADIENKNINKHNPVIDKQKNT